MTPILALATALFLCPAPRAIDGDTFACAGGLRVRVWGVQAPEAHDPGGPEATAALDRLIAGRTLICIPRGRSYARVVALCFIPRGAPDQDLAAELVRTGHATDWPRYSHGAYATP